MGVYKAIRELALGQLAAGAEVHLLINGRWPEDGVRAAGIVVHEGSLRDNLRVLRSLNDTETVLHTHMIWSPVALLPLMMRGSRIRSVISPHGCLAAAAIVHKRLKKALFWRLLWRRAVKRHAMLIATSEAERLDLASHQLGLPVTIVPNPLSGPRQASFEGVRKQQVVGYLGRFHPIKGLRELVEAWQVVSTDFPGWRLQIVGAADIPAYEEEVRRLASRDPSVAISPAVFGDSKWRFLAGCELVAVPSHAENFCYVVAEAYLAGTPVLASTGVPWPEINERDMGWRGEGSAGTLATLLREALGSDGEERSRKAAVGKAFVNGEFGLARVAERSFEAYRAILK